ncbi:acetyl-CoA carboxylase [Cavenderia fasciculata]|uniref:Acetyl-CoA carboxylase n=1 Tax=Cavenderia fasciculata TaxID=261658 RepID=F4PI59_CACFS|nr:acetyl-CoA carboxylase [Cavenderia fasciculata]EGG25342.1 acetyl-CoA carboxylase [Cavenderia fasciculata]|eukprot:XP_004363193.1 acetyl-CoA carboxylase [Cavenderia fasciculata]
MKMNDGGVHQDCHCLFDTISVKNNNSMGGEMYITYIDQQQQQQPQDKQRFIQEQEQGRIIYNQQQAFKIDNPTTISKINNNNNNNNNSVALHYQLQYNILYSTAGIIMHMDHSKSLILEEYINQLNGTKIIKKILIANNGIAAVKAIRSVRKWAYTHFGNERAIEFVVMATPEDMKANAEYIRMADQIIEVPGGSNNNNYANVDTIVDLAERAGVQAVWAGWGHASENPRLPDLLSKTSTSISFIGPPAGPMRDLGDKIASTIVAQSARVACVPWSGQGLTVDYQATGGVDAAIYRKATVETVDEAKEVIEKIGFPAMIKASEGGGGKGIRKVTSMDELAASFRQVQSEVPGSPVFIMKLVPNARHLEVQIVGDQYGEAISLNGRDCSVQRRHQKIIEEGPALAPTPEVWLEMERAAVRLVKEVGYVGAGTVEYLFADGDYFFLELNPRLQVEHPVTEEITGVNLPATQLQIAMGIPLFRIPDIRRLYGQTPFGDAAIDLQDYAKRLPPKGHCIAVRITGENPDEGFKPTSGGIHELTFRSTPNVWGYFSVGANGGLHEYADSQFGHIFASGPTREDARKSMVLGLKEISIRGDIRTPVEYIIHLLETDDFKNNAIHTGWLDKRIADKIKSHKPDTQIVVLCGALYKAYTTYQQRLVEFTGQVTVGQLPSLELLANIVPVELIYHNIKYQFEVIRRSPTSFAIVLVRDKTNIVDVNVVGMTDGGLIVMMNGKTHVVYGRDEVTGLRLMIDQKTCTFSQEYDPSILRTPSPGKLVRYLVDDGSVVSKGAAYAEIEVMKMYMPLVAPESGRIKFHLSEGGAMGAGAIIANLELEEGCAVQKSTVFAGTLDRMQPPILRGEKPHQLAKATLVAVKNVLTGYEVCSVQTLIDNLFVQMTDPLLPYYELNESLSVIHNRIPAPLCELIREEISNALVQRDQFTSKVLLHRLNNYLTRQMVENESAAKTIATTVAPIADLAKRYVDGAGGARIATVRSILEDFITLEDLVQHRNIQTVLKSVRQLYKDDIKKVGDVALSIHPQSKKYALVQTILKKIDATNSTADYTDQLKKLSGLSGASIEISLRAKQIIVNSQLPSGDQRVDQLRRSIKNIIDIQKQSAADLEGSTDSTTSSSSSSSTPPTSINAPALNQIAYLKEMSLLTKQTAEICDILVPNFTADCASTRKVAMEAYIRHSYRSYFVEDTRVTDSLDERSKQRGFNCVEWHFYISLPSGNNSPTLQQQQHMALSRSHNGGAGLNGSRSHNPIMNGLSMLRTDSTDSLQAVEDQCKLRYGMMVHFADETSFAQTLPQILRYYNVEDDFNGGRPKNQGGESTDILSVVLTGYYPDTLAEENSATVRFAAILKSNYRELITARVRRVTFERGKRETDPDADRCFFVRSVLRYGDLSGSNEIKIVDILLSQIEAMLSESLEALEMTIASAKRYERAQNHNIFLNILPEVMFDERMIGYVVQEIGDRLGARMWKLRVGQVEVKGKLRKENQLIPVRFFVQNPTGYAFQVYCYYEQLNAAGQLVFAVVPGSNRGIWEGMPVDTPYPIMDAVQRNRFKAQRLDTTYVYDFPDLFQEALQSLWVEYMDANRANPKKVNPPPRAVVDAVELILAPGTKTDVPPTVPFCQLPEDIRPKLEETYRPIGYNDIGMVAWRMTLYTPEYPAGRQVIVIANDITHQIGSFGPQEDLLFQLASETARTEQIPRIYLSSNSGARIGLADEVKQKFKVLWNNDKDPSKGVRALYLEDQDYQRLAETNAISAVKQDDKWILTDIIGQKNGIGVENLSWSGLIAGETSKAYKDIFTITLVTGRSVGIGAYLVRLGQRTIQNDAPIILTGASALNKVLGKDVYESNQQLGGAQIMYPNGVSHISVNDELAGIRSILHWVSYVPRSKGEMVPILAPIDTPNREIDFDPSLNTKYNIRDMIQGHSSDIDPLVWISGLFDRDSFTETLGGWAKTVVCGRARLGGIPVGVIGVETRTIEKVVPADPANPLSQEVVSSQAAQVWYPDSSFKTAQAIADFNNGEELPLFILANWRGFSGGMRDMFDEILKFGSMIVDNLRDYKQPVIVYIPPEGELRGGAWVVLDSTINLDMMEMYASESARGGVLEPNGIVEIKYRDPELIRTMHRLDSRLIQLDAEIAQAASADDAKPLRAQAAAREKELLSIYQQIAIKFADLHDTPGRMKAKGVIADVVQWKTSRFYFYNRLRCRLFEEQQLRLIARVNPTLSRLQRRQLLDGWIANIAPANTPAETLHNNEWRADFIDKSFTLLTERISQLRSQYIQQQIMEFNGQDNEAVLDGFVQILNSLPPDQKKYLLSKLNQ